MAVFPIVIDGEFMGTVVGVGFIKDTAEANRIDEVRDRLSAQGETRDTIDFAVSKIRFLDDNDRAHFIDLVDLVSREIVTLHSGDHQSRRANSRAE
jgi:two-component system response regulator HupR/HoxA